MWHWRTKSGCMKQMWGDEDCQFFFSPRPFNQAMCCLGYGSRMIISAASWECDPDREARAIIRRKAAWARGSERTGMTDGRGACRRGGGSPEGGGRPASSSAWADWAASTQTSTHLVCAVKLFQTFSSLSFAKLSKLSSKHGATQSKTEPKLALFKANTVAVYSLQKTNKTKKTPGQHSLTPSSRRSTPARPNFHSFTLSFLDWLADVCLLVIRSDCLFLLGCYGSGWLERPGSNFRSPI